MTQREQVLALLKERGEAGVTSGEFLGGYLPRFSARILELRDEGYTITSERLSASSWRYRLEGLAEGELTGREAVKGTSAPATTHSSPSASLFDLAPVSGTKSAVTGERL